MTHQKQKSLANLPTYEAYHAQNRKIIEPTGGEYDSFGGFANRLNHKDGFNYIAFNISISALKG